MIKGVFLKFYSHYNVVMYLIFKIWNYIVKLNIIIINSVLANVVRDVHRPGGVIICAKRLAETGREKPAVDFDKLMMTMMHLYTRSAVFDWNSKLYLCIYYKSHTLAKHNWWAATKYSVAKTILGDDVITYIHSLLRT